MLMVIYRQLLTLYSLVCVSGFGLLVWPFGPLWLHFSLVSFPTKNNHPMLTFEKPLSMWYRSAWFKLLQIDKSDSSERFSRLNQLNWSLNALLPCGKSQCYRGAYCGIPDAWYPICLYLQEAIWLTLLSGRPNAMMMYVARSPFTIRS